MLCFLLFPLAFCVNSHLRQRHPSQELRHTYLILACLLQALFLIHPSSSSRLKIQIAKQNKNPRAKKQRIVSEYPSVPPPESFPLVRVFFNALQDF